MYWKFRPESPPSPVLNEEVPDALFFLIITECFFKGRSESPNRSNVSPQSTVTRYEWDFLLYADNSFNYQKEVKIPMGKNKKNHLLCIKRLESLLTVFLLQKIVRKKYFSRILSYMCHLKIILRLNIQVILLKILYNVLSLHLQIRPTPGHRPTEPAPSVLLLYPLRDR